ncbi:MAG TPA: capsule assembly Wzi family protein [Gemmatimonadaceae bacterium]|nr:capsule assembly Wzi family protein [Gemmatimonadaceae bacterium]
MIWLVSHLDLERYRLAELVDESGGVPLMLRSPGVLLARGTRGNGVGALLPEVQFVVNSALPFSVNDGALWAGRGANIRAIGGFTFRAGRFHGVVAPELVISSNQEFELRIPPIERPPIPPDRSEWQFEWYAFGPYSIDMPTRFGDASIQRLYPGQSSIAVTLGSLELGGATENHWWGPGIANALILSNNAPGFPHLFVRSGRPIGTRFGDLEFRWLVGGLRESKFFDTLSTNDLRSIGAAAATLALRRPAGLTVGAARSVWGTATGWGDIPLRWMEVFHSTGRPSARPLNDSTLYPGGREQVFSLFARWVFPEAGLETYAEWGRTEFPASLRDALMAPNHTQAYTLGLQWRRSGFHEGDFWRVHVENTSVEQGPSFRDRPLGVWYTSRQVVQGYTNEGQPLGAAVGPGSSGQILAVDYMRPRIAVGVKAGRMRLNEDVRSISPILDFKRWCTHDIYLYGGPRVSVLTGLGLIAADVTMAHRIHPWFQVQSGCPRGDAMVDIHNTTLTLTIAPFQR